MLPNNWSSSQFFGWKSYVSKEKLKALKGDLKTQNNQFFGNLDSHITYLRQEVNSMDARVEQGKLSVSEIDYRKKVISDLWSLLWNKDAQFFQRFRVKWLKKGDANISFFHACINIRSRRNAILSLKVYDALVVGVSKVGQEVVHQFSNNF